MQNEKQTAERICELAISEYAKKRRSLRLKIEEYFDNKCLHERFGVDDFMQE